MSSAGRQYRLRWLDSRNLVLVHRMGGQGRDRIWGYFVTVRGAIRSAVREGLFRSAEDFVGHAVFDSPELEADAWRVAGASKHLSGTERACRSATESPAPISEGAGRRPVIRREAKQ